MPEIAQGRIDRIRREVDPVDLVAQYTDAPRRAPRGHVARCPVHAENSPSLMIYDGQEDPYHCYGCGFHGDVIALVRAMEDVEFPAAVEWVERWSGLVPGVEGEEPRPRRRPPPTREDDWRLVTPVPRDRLAIAPEKFPVKDEESGEWHHHEPVDTHVYRQADGQVLWYVRRFADLPSGKVRPLTYWQNALGERKWRWRHPGFGDHGVALYGLDLLARWPDRTYVLHEGEKAADGFNRMMLASTDYVGIATMGGAWVGHHADLRPLLGRRGRVMADANDPAGVHYAWQIAECLRLLRDDANDEDEDEEAVE